MQHPLAAHAVFVCARTTLFVMGEVVSHSHICSEVELLVVYAICWVFSTPGKLAATLIPDIQGRGAYWFVRNHPHR
jgi:hypothetical protein